MATVFGEVRQGGVLVPNRSVMVGTPGQRMGVPVAVDEHGVFRFFVKPGTCTVQAWNEVPGSSARVLVCERSVLVASGAEVRCDLDVPDLRLILSIDDGGTAAVAGLEFEIASEEDLGLGRVSAVLSAADGRSCVFGNLACGTWLVRAKAPGLLSGEPQRIELSPRSPHAIVVLPVRPAGIVRVVARNLAGEVMVLAPAGPVLVTSRGELAGIDLGRAGRGVITTEDFGFIGVPLGRAELRLRDRELAGRTLFLPFDAVPAQAVDVVSGDHNRVELRVERRAQVRLRVVDSVGREEPTARIVVLAGAREVHSTEPQPSRWRCHLPPDEYRIVVERTSGRSEQRLLVGRQDLDLKLRP